MSAAYIGQQVRDTAHLFKAPVRAACSFIDQAVISTPPLGLSNSWSHSWDVSYMPSGTWVYKALSRQIEVLVTYTHSCNLCHKDCRLLNEYWESTAPI